MNSTIKITVSQPLPSMPQEPAFNPPQKKPTKKNDIANPIGPPPNRPQDEAPFIANDRPQYTDELFDKKDAIDFYIDGCRFLPENCSYTRITTHILLKGGKVIGEPFTSYPDLSVSQSGEPFYGFRGEIRSTKLDPTAFLLFTLDTFDLSIASPKLLGHAVLPLFLDSKSRSP